MFRNGHIERRADQISQRLGAGRGLVLDVTDGRRYHAAIAEISNQAVPVEILVNNAAITRDQLRFCA